MFDKVTIAYRGAKYEIGRGRDFYGVWTAGGSRSQPVKRWPETPDGWSAAWARFTEIEEPGTIAPAGRKNAVPRQGAPPREGAGLAPASGAVAAAALLAVGVAVGVAGLFPVYFTGTSLASESAQLIPHVIYLAAWSASAVLILLGGARLRAGALLGTGLSLVTFGLFLADAGTPISGGAHLAGAGMWLSLAGWLACAAGSAVAFLLRPTGPLAQGAPDGTASDGTASDGTASDGTTPYATNATAGRPGWRGHLGMPRGAALGPAILLVLAGLGVAAAFAPAWDSYTLRTAAGQTQYLTAGDAFANPGAVIVGDVAVMVALAAVVIAAAAWRPVRDGAMLLVGAIIPMAAQAISALVQAGEATSPQQFGLTPAQVTQLGLTIDNGLTPAFWIYCVLLVTLAVSCLWMFFMAATGLPAPAPARDMPRDVPPEAPAQGASAEGDAYGWNPAWYVATPDASGVSSPQAPAPGTADAPQKAADQHATDHDQAT